jgi:hypothetical protein
LQGTRQTAEAASLKKTNLDILAGTCYIWLKNTKNLTEKQRARLSHLERLNLKVNEHRTLLGARLLLP